MSYVSGVNDDFNVRGWIDYTTTRLTGWGSRQRELLYNFFDKEITKDLRKKTHEDIVSMVGTYPLEPFERPAWFIEMCNEFNYYFESNVSDERIDQINAELEKYAEVGDIWKGASQFLKAVHQYQTATPRNIADGKFPNGQKIAKFLKKVCEIELGKEKDHMASDWARTFEKNNTSNNELEVIITDSAPSIIGMSEYFGKSGMSSCQTISIGDNRTHASNIFDNLKDEGLLVAYVTDGKKVKMHSYDGFYHNKMIERILLRYMIAGEGMKFRDASGEKITSSVASKKLAEPIKMLMVDRSYPTGQYVNEVLNILKNLCDERGIKLVVRDSWKSAQNGSTNMKSFTKGTEKYSGVTIPTVALRKVCMELYTQRDGRCSKIKENKPCDVCNPFSKEICKTCPSEIQSKTTIACSTCRLIRRGEPCVIEPEHRNCCVCPYTENGIKIGYNDNLSVGYYEEGTGRAVGIGTVVEILRKWWYVKNNA